jgi:hypothetical protein
MGVFGEAIHHHHDNIKSKRIRQSIDKIRGDILPNFIRNQKRL